MKKLRPIQAKFYLKTHFSLASVLFEKRGTGQLNELEQLICLCRNKEERNPHEPNFHEVRSLNPQFSFRLRNIPPQIGHLCHIGTLSVMNNQLQFLPSMCTFLPDTVTLRGRYGKKTTVKLPSSGTDRSELTVQTQIRLLLKEQSDQGLHCLHLLDTLLHCKTNLVHFQGRYGN